MARCSARWRSGSRSRARFRARELELIDVFAAAIAAQLARLNGERRLAAAAARLRAADRRKAEFLAILAHELRNPLTPIHNAVEALKLEPKVRVASEVIDRQVRYLSRLVDDLLDLARIGRGKLTIATERIDLRDVVRQAVETSCKSLLATAGHELVITLPEAPIPITGDFTRLAQVVANLLTNAARYTSTGGRVDIALDPPEGESTVLRVRENGRGMDAATLANVFEMFYQGPRNESGGGGLGIGLALVKRRVTLHGGSVEARSAGPGREFVVRLPRLVGGEVAAPKPLRVLVVDDNRDAADSTVLLLEIKGFEAFAAYDGEEAVARACALRPDVVLLDLDLPKQSGHDACRAIRAAGLRDTFIVAVTGYDDADMRRRSAAAGCDANQVKPVGAAVIERLLVARKGPRRDVPAASAPRRYTNDAS